jgi:hypothetical protein
MVISIKTLRKNDIFMVTTLKFKKRAGGNERKCYFRMVCRKIQN